MRVIANIAGVLLALKEGVHLFKAFFLLCHRIIVEGGSSIVLSLQIEAEIHDRAERN